MAIAIYPLSLIIRCLTQLTIVWVHFLIITRFKSNINKLGDFSDSVNENAEGFDIRSINQLVNLIVALQCTFGFVQP